jgi:hypothetical protein
VAPQTRYCFEAAVPGAEIGQLKVGMPVKIRFDAYDYQKYGALAGAVTYVDGTASRTRINQRACVYSPHCHRHMRPSRLCPISARRKLCVDPSVNE